MGTKQKSLTIILEPEVWNEEIVSLLVRQGHTVKALQTHGYDLIIGPRAWRVPTGPITVKDISTILTQAKKIIKAEAAPQVEPLDLHMEDIEHDLDDTQVPLEEEDGKVITRVVSAYRPASRPGKKKQRTKVTRGGYAATDQGYIEEGC